MTPNDNIVVFTEAGVQLWGQALYGLDLDTRAGIQEARSYTQAPVQVYSLASNLEVKQSGVFMAEHTQCSKALVPILKMPTQ